MQDFPLLWGYARSVRAQAVDQARAAVDQLGHHPSIVSWTAHNDPAAVAIGIEGDSPRDSDPVPHRPPAAVVEQDDPRPLGEAVVREGRPDPPVHPPLRCAPAPPATRRHRQPLLLRLVPRRRPRPRPPGFADPAAVPVPVGVRRPGGARVGRVHRSGAVARPRLGHARRAARTPEVGVRRSRPARPVRNVRRLAARHAGVPSGAAPTPHRGVAPAEVSADGRIRPVLVQRPGSGGVVQRARPRARAEARLRRREQVVRARGGDRRPSAGLRRRWRRLATRRPRRQRPPCRRRSGGCRRRRQLGRRRASMAVRGRDTGRRMRQGRRHRARASPTRLARSRSTSR